MYLVSYKTPSSGVDKNIVSSGDTIAIHYDLL